MEYMVIIKNPFSRDRVVTFLRGGHGGVPLFVPEILLRPYLPGSTLSLSTTVLPHRPLQFTGSMIPFYQDNDFALYYLSSKGGAERDYYLFDNRCLIYERRTKWSYWDSPLVPTHIMPIDSPIITSEYGPRWGKKHGGVDMAHTNATKTNGLSVRATIGGRVVRVVHRLDGDPGGIRVAILAKNGYRYNYYHLQLESNIHIMMNALVSQGDVLGKVGGSGFFKADNYVPHLHYEIWKENDRSQRISPELVHPEISKLPRR